MHEKNAIEVYYLEALVGWVNGIDGAATQKRKISLFLNLSNLSEGTGPLWAEPHIEERAFSVTYRVWSYSPYETHADPDEFRNKKNNLPPYASEHRHEDEELVTWSWQILSVESFEEYEWLFDYPNFVPANAPDDPDLKLSEAMARVSATATATALSARSLRASSAMILEDEYASSDWSVDWGLPSLFKTGYDAPKLYTDVDFKTATVVFDDKKFEAELRAEFLNFRNTFK